MIKRVCDSIAVVDDDLLLLFYVVIVYICLEVLIFTYNAHTQDIINHYKKEDTINCIGYGSFSCIIQTLVTTKTISNGISETRCTVNYYVVLRILLFWKQKYFTLTRNISFATHQRQRSDVSLFRLRIPPVFDFAHYNFRVKFLHIQIPVM